MSLSQDSLKANLSQPAQAFTWELKIPNFPAGVGDTETLMLRCQSTSMPGRRVGVIEIPYKQGPKLQFPGKLDYTHNLSCTFIEGEDNAALDTFYAWAQRIVNDVTNEGGSEAEVKTDVYLSLLTRADGSEYRQIRLVGCFVSEINDVALDYNDEAVIRLTVNLRYDRWEIVV